MEQVNSMKTLIKEYEESEAELIATKKLYDKLQQLVVQENEKLRKEEREVNLAKKVLSEAASPTIRASNSKKSIKNLKDIKSSPVLTRTSSEAKASISKSVERRINHLENYKNLMKQSKVSTEKLAFLDLLNNSS